MSSIKSWKSRTAAFMALAIATGTAAPIVISAPATAQLFPRSNYPQSNYPQSTQVTIPTGTSIPVRYEKAEKIVVAPNETMQLTLNVATDIVNRNGRVLIPAGSEVIGQLEPATGGSQFVARELVTYQGTRQSINATSRVISQTEVRRGPKTGNILKGAAVGAAAAVALGALTGDRAIATEEVLLGTGAGALGGVFLGRRKADVVVIDPNTDLNLTLRSNLALR